MLPARFFSRIPARNWRAISQFSRLNQEQQQTAKTDVASASPPPAEAVLTIPPSSTADKPVSPKIDRLAGEIAMLNLLEVSELSSVLKSRLNLPDVAAVPVGGFAQAAAPAEEDDDAEPTAVKSSFNVKLMAFDEKQKVPLIKEIKGLMEGFNLVQAKKFIDGAPAIIRTDVAKEEADRIKALVEKCGGKVEID